jgi:hypothetical protein
MYPSFVIERTSQHHPECRTLYICDRLYLAHPTDTQIDNAIQLAASWLPTQITYERIIHLRNWLQENVQRKHNIPFKQLRCMASCQYFIDCIIHLNYATSKAPHEQGFFDLLRENKKIFSE